jgi:hypothetical protein
VAMENVVPQLESIVGAAHLNMVATSGGKVVLTNNPMVVSREEPPKTVAVF